MASVPSTNSTWQTNDGFTHRHSFIFSSVSVRAIANLFLPADSRMGIFPCADFLSAEKSHREFSARNRPSISRRTGIAFCRKSRSATGRIQGPTESFAVSGERRIVAFLESTVRQHSPTVRAAILKAGWPPSAHCPQPWCRSTTPASAPVAGETPRTASRCFVGYKVRINATMSPFSGLVSLSSNTKLKNSTVSSNVRQRPS
jgi:hypothetical protein